jgi:hypothetical protein
MKVKEADLSVSFPLPSFSGPHAELPRQGQGPKNIEGYYSKEKNLSLPAGIDFYIINLHC